MGHLTHAPSVGSASRTLGLLEERERKRNDACTDEQSNKHITGHQIPNNAKARDKSSTCISQQSSDGDSLLKSFLLPKKNYGCGSWNRTNSYRFRAYRVSITPSREISVGKYRSTRRSRSWNFASAYIASSCLILA